MDRKQTLIFDKVLDENKLPDPTTFKQYRNLKEFKYFIIERINPNHKIFLYGVLKNNNKKKDTSKTFIKVGEIIIVISSFSCNMQLFYENINLITLIFSMFCLNIFLFYLFGNFNLMRCLIDYRNRGIYGRWKNHINGT
jgi:hypothetical protein